MKKDIDFNILFKISLICSLVGIMVLFFISSFEPKIIEISNLSQTNIGNKVKITGEITNNKNPSPNFFILTLKDDTGNIEVLLDKEFSSEKQIEIIGIIEEYQEKLQIRAEKIKEIEEE